MKFNLKGVKGTASNHLKAWGIYDVVFRGVEYVEGTSAKGNAWQGMQVTFAGDAGTYSKTFFCPGDGAEERLSGESNGRKWTLPSNAEVFSAVLAHLGENLSPDKYKKFQELEWDLPKDFEKLVAKFDEALAPAKNKATTLKLVANKKNYADIPNFVSVNSKGDAVINNNWVGKNVAFTDKELIAKEKRANEKPTEMSTATGIDTTNKDIDLDALNREL